jgi:GNAT superfamily N-acetyltransferase
METTGTEGPATQGIADRAAITTAGHKFRVELLPREAAANGALLSALTSMVNEAFGQSERGILADGAFRASAADLAALTRAGEIAIASQDDRPLGCIRIRRLDNSSCQFGMLASDRGHRGIGIGRELIRFAEQQARVLGCSVAQLEVLVPVGGKHPAKEFLDQWYSQMGYKFTSTAPVAEVDPELPPRLAVPCQFRIYRKDIRTSSRTAA